MGNTKSSATRSAKGRLFLDSRQLPDGPFHELPEELILLIISFLYTPSDPIHSCGDMARLMGTCRAFYNLIHCEKAQLELWLPWTAQALDQTVEETIKVFEREGDYKEVNWKERFVEVSSSPVFNPHDIASVCQLVDKWTIVDVGALIRPNCSYFYARARLPILPGTRKYFEVKVLRNCGAMVGVMLKKGALYQNVPTKNFYHGLCAGYNDYQSIPEPIVGVLVCNDQPNGSCILHFFVNDEYTHSERLMLEEMQEKVAQPVYPAIATHSPADSFQFVRINKSIKALSRIGSTWPQHPFASHGLGIFI